MTVLQSLNSGGMYLICGAIVAFIAVVCVVFMIRAWRMGKALGMDTTRMKRAITASATFSVLPSVGLIGVAYLLLRCIGKWGGTYLGAVCVKADKHIRHYLGLTLLPQAGVAIGMAALVSARFPTLAAQVNTIVLAGVLVFELIGPVITKIALTKAGEIPAAK